jgi:hypothetical protein
MIMKILKWTVILLLSLLVAGAAYLSLTRESTNASVVEELRQNPQGERATRTMLITLSDGRMYPVNYLREANLVFMGIDGRWWREFLGEGQPVGLSIQGENFSGHALTVLDRPEYKADVFSRLRPAAPAWLPDWLNGKLVVITLDDGM